jgi:hypothetical protein
MRDTTTKENFPAGRYFSAATNLNRWFGLTGEISGAHEKVAGIARGRIVPFALQPGGGVTAFLTENVSVRGAVDDRRIVFTDADEFDEDNSKVRAIAGVVFGWGAR